jgi:prophage regulatory protein
VGISRTTAWRLQKAGDFPRPYVVSPGRVAYRESEVEAWKASRGHRSPAAVFRRAGSAPRDAPPAPPPASRREGASVQVASIPPPAPPPGPPPPRPFVRPIPRARTAKPQRDQMTFDF